MTLKQTILTATLATAVLAATPAQADPLSTAEECLGPVAAVGFFLSESPHYEMDGLTGRKARIAFAALVDIIVNEKYGSVPGDARWQNLKGAVSDRTSTSPAARDAYIHIKRNIRRDGHPFAGDDDLRQTLSRCLKFAYEKRLVIQGLSQ